MLPKRHHKRLLHKVLGILPIISWILLSTSLNLELLLSTAYIGLTKPVFTANMAASLFLTSLLFRTEPSLPYHFTVDNTGWFCAPMKIGVTSSKATRYTPTLLAPY